MEVISKLWTKSLLSRMGCTKRKCSNDGKIASANIAENFLADIQAQVLLNNIPNELIINWDQTGLPLVPTGEWIMHCTGDKIVPITKSDDKRQITAVFAASIAGEYLSPQLLFQGKTTRCHPSVTFPEGWDIWHSENHWSNQKTMIRYMERIIIPFWPKSV